MGRCPLQPVGRRSNDHIDRPERGFISEVISMTAKPVPGGAPISAGPGHAHTQLARRAVGLAEVAAVVVAVSYAIVGVAFAVGGTDAISDNWVGMLGAVALLGGLWRLWSPSGWRSSPGEARTVGAAVASLVSVSWASGHRGARRDTVARVAARPWLRHGERITRWRWESAPGLRRDGSSTSGRGGRSAPRSRPVPPPSPAPPPGSWWQTRPARQPSPDRPTQAPTLEPRVSCLTRRWPSVTRVNTTSATALPMERSRSGRRRWQGGSRRPPSRRSPWARARRRDVPSPAGNCPTVAI